MKKVSIVLILVAVIISAANLCSADDTKTGIGAVVSNGMDGMYDLLVSFAVLALTAFFGFLARLIKGGIGQQIDANKDRYARQLVKVVEEKSRAKEKFEKVKIKSEVKFSKVLDGMKTKFAGMTDDEAKHRALAAVADTKGIGATSDLGQ